MILRTLVISAVLGAALLASRPDPSFAQEPACWLRGATMEEAAQRPSPLGETLITFGDETGKACYGRPSARGRPVAGNLIPYASPWRMGANEATVLHLPFPTLVGELELPPGDYSLYTVAGESEWEIVVNGTANRWGIPINDEVIAGNLGSFRRPVQATDGMVEELTFTWAPISDQQGNLIVEWEHSRVEIPIMKRDTPNQD